MEEKDLIIEAKNGSGKAFEKIVKLYEGKIFSFAFYYLKNRCDAEDVTQEVFWKVFTQLRKYNESMKFFTWIYTIFLNTVRTYIRAKEKHKKLNIDDGFMETVIVNPSFEISSVEKLSLFQALEKLDPLDQNILYLKYSEGLSVKEISELLNLTEENIKVRIFRGKKKLLDLLLKEGV